MNSSGHVMYICVYFHHDGNRTLIYFPTEIKPKPIQGMGYGVKLTDLKKDAGTKKDTEGPTSNGSPKILGSSGSSAFQPVSKNKEPPKENGRKL